MDKRETDTSVAGKKEEHRTEYVREQQRVFVFPRERHGKHDVVVVTPDDLRVRALVQVLVHKWHSAYAHEFEGLLLSECKCAHKIGSEDAVTGYGTAAVI